MEPGLWYFLQMLTGPDGPLGPLSDIPVHFNVPGELDLLHLQHVLHELMYNTYKYSGQRPEATLHFSPAAEHPLLHLLYNHPAVFVQPVSPQMVGPSSGGPPTFLPHVEVGVLNTAFGPVKLIRELWMLQDKKERLIFEALVDRVHTSFRAQIVGFSWKVPAPDVPTPEPASTSQPTDH